LGRRSGVPVLSGVQCLELGVNEGDGFADAALVRRLVHPPAHAGRVREWYGHRIAVVEALADARVEARHTE
jgi:hypothetical protein